MTTWPPRAADLPRWRDELMIDVAARGPAVYAKYIRDGNQPVRPDGDPDSAGIVMARAEARRLLMAELFFVSSGMTELATAAASTLPEFTLMPEDLPALHGLVVFEAPIYRIHYEGEGTRDLVAAAWGPWRGGPQWWDDGALWMDWYVSRVSFEAATGWATEGPSLMHDNESQCPFSAKPIEVQEGGSHVWMKVLRATWLLMSQTIATVTEVDFDRAAKRRAARAAGKPPPRVRLVRLRRRSYGASDAGAGREYHHQWIVRGHWRNQWHPARGVHRPLWIAPHLKGPEDAPLLGGEKVYSLER